LLACASLVARVTDLLAGQVITVMITKTFFYM